MITSIQNERVKQWYKLKQRKHREREGKFLIEGFHLLEEAYRSNWEIETIICQEETRLPQAYEDLEIVTVNQAVFNHLAETKSPQGVIAVLKQKSLPWEKDGHVLLLDRLQDPGNLGSIIRTADAAGFSALYLGKGTVDPFNDKVLRATQGSIFRMPLIACDLLSSIKSLQAASYQVLATDLGQGAMTYDQMPQIEKAALILGNEGQGIDPALVDAADLRVKIPIYGGAESLNVSVAAGILMYHLQHFA